MKKLLGIVGLGLLLCSPGSSESTWDSNYRYNKQKWDATSTNHIKNSIFKDRKFKRDTSSKESIHFILETQKCIPHSTSGDCERTVRRSQIRSKKTYKREKDYIFIFSIYHKEVNTPGHIGNHKSEEKNKLDMLRIRAKELEQALDYNGAAKIWDQLGEIFSKL